MSSWLVFCTQTVPIPVASVLNSAQPWSPLKASGLCPVETQLSSIEPPPSHPPPTSLPKVASDLLHNKGVETNRRELLRINSKSPPGGSSPLYILTDVTHRPKHVGVFSQILGPHVHFLQLDSIGSHTLTKGRAIIVCVAAAPVGWNDKKLRFRYLHTRTLVRTP